MTWNSMYQLVDLLYQEFFEEQYACSFAESAISILIKTIHDEITVEAKYDDLARELHKDHQIDVEEINEFFNIDKESDQQVIKRLLS